MNLQTLLDAAKALGPVLGALPAIREVFDNAVTMLSVGDQATAKEELARLRAENDELHERLQNKLADASRVG